MPKQSASVKTFVLDTNVLITSPYSVYTFDEHNVVISDITLEELDGLKTREGETGANAREAVRIIEGLRQRGRITEGVSLGEGFGLFRVEVNHADVDLPVGWSDSKADHRIIRMCLALRKQGQNVILVSNDSLVRIKADIIGIEVEEYRTDRVEATDKQYKGRREVFVESGVIAQFYQNGGTIERKKLKASGDEDYTDLAPNEFLLLKDEVNPKSSALARYNDQNGSVEGLRYFDEKNGPWGVSARNIGQKFIFEALLAPVEVAPLVIIKGGPGTAKTFCALAAGLQQVLEPSASQRYRKMLISRPNIKFDEDIGFLKGTEWDKISPLLRPVFDNLETLMGKRTVKGAGKYDDDYGHSDKFGDFAQDAVNATISQLFERGLLSGEALAYFRGRSICDNYILVDESQNMTPEQAYGVISRAGEGSKIVLVGDVGQIDRPHLDSRTNGLSYASEKMKGSSYTWQLTFDDEECSRSVLALEAMKRMSPKGYRNR
jgi:PhoH-like ATPase